MALYETYFYVNEIELIKYYNFYYLFFYLVIVKQKIIGCYNVLEFFMSSIQVTPNWFYLLVKNISSSDREN